uniref:Uncharacterized protein n=1 Tax=Neovison vison TaxID=452646 RepID=A0A8C7EM52_NEOVI
VRRIPSSRRQKVRREPPWGAPWGLEVGVGTDESRHSSPGSWLWTLHQSRHPLCPQPFSCPLSRRCPFDPHSVIVLPLDLLRLRSPGGRQPLFSLSFLLFPLPLPACTLSISVTNK